MAFLALCFLVFLPPLIQGRSAGAATELSPDEPADIADVKHRLTDAPSQKKVGALFRREFPPAHADVQRNAAAELERGHNSRGSARLEEAARGSFNATSSSFGRFIRTSSIGSAANHLATSLLEVASEVDAPISGVSDAARVATPHAATQPVDPERAAAASPQDTFRTLFNPGKWFTSPAQHREGEPSIGQPPALQTLAAAALLISVLAAVSFQASLPALARVSAEQAMRSEEKAAATGMLRSIASADLIVPMPLSPSSTCDTNEVYSPHKAFTGMPRRLPE